MESQSAQQRLAATYDGGIVVLDADAGTVIADFKIAGFNRINPAGDGRHVLVSTAGGFQVLDAGAWSERHGDHAHHFTAAPALEELKFPAQQPGHVVRHAGKTILFDDGTGTVNIFDPSDLSEGVLPATKNHKTPRRITASRWS